MSADAVELRGVTVRYDDFTALSNISLTAGEGEVLGIVGPNGSGKSTLLKSVAGLVEPYAGRLTVYGEAPHALPPGTIAYVPQVEAVDWSFPATVRDVVGMARFHRLHFWQHFSADDHNAVARALELVHMDHVANRQIAQLSGGQQQRAFVARAIAQEPKVLLLDEPTTGVDVATEESLRVVVRELAAGGITVLMTTHDLDRVGVWFDRMLVLDHRLLVIGTPDEVLASGAYAAIREHTHVHGHLRTDHEPHAQHAAHPEARR